jgi:hypothetical protein
MANPKLEFFRFKLNHKKEKFSTFRDFLTEELGANKTISDENAFKLCFKHFIKSLGKDFAQDDKLKKQLVVIKKSTVNKHLDKQPTFNAAGNLIYGVINGGPYGRDRIISNIEDQEDSTVLGRNKSVLLYFYFFLYCPLDHNEGCFIIHSNSSEETITQLFRNYISNLFKGNNFNKASIEIFCPKSFQDEFKNGAVLRSLTFKSSFIDNIPSTDGISHLFQNYDIKIEAIPRNKKISVSEASTFRKYLSKKIFGTKEEEKRLTDFEEVKVSTENDITNATKVFEWNNIDSSFVPVVYINGRIEKMNDDGTPDFIELNEFCLNIFKDEILIEIRPDLNVVRIK